MKSYHQHDLRRARFILMCLLMGLELVCTASRLSATEQQPARHHSLIHRQESDSKSHEPSTVPPTALAATSGARSLHRKLTKRLTQGTITAPSAGSAQGTAPLSQPTPTVPTRGDSRLSTGGTAIATQAPLPVSSASPVASAPLAGATLSTSKPAAASALAGTGIAAAVSPASGVTGGRGMQRLVGQMAGLSQLLAPTLSIPTPPSSSPPPPPPPSPPLSPPPPTSSAPPPSTGSAMLSWTTSSASDLTGYKIYVGTTSGQYTYPGSPIVIGRASSYTVTGLPANQTYYFAISAFNSDGESGLSAEVSKSIY